MSTKNYFKELTKADEDPYVVLWISTASAIPNLVLQGSTNAGAECPRGDTHDGSVKIQQRPLRASEVRCQKWFHGVISVGYERPS